MVKWCKFGAFGVVVTTESFASLAVGVNFTTILKTTPKWSKLYDGMVYDVIYDQKFAVIPTIDESNTRWSNKRLR